MIDWETLAIGGDAVVLSLGIIPFDLGEDKTFAELVSQGQHHKFEVASQVQKHGRRIDTSTVEWWAGQGEEAKRVLEPNHLYDKQIEVIPDIVKTVIDKLDCKPKEAFWYSRGSMDYEILTHIYQSLGVPLPYAYYAIRDTRTALHWCVGAERGNIDLPDGYLDGFVKHNASHDCASDILQLQYAFKLATGEIEVD